jgi:hypothetical protein
MYVNLSEFYRLAANRAPVVDKQSQGHGTPSNPMITPVHEFMSSIMYGTIQYRLCSYWVADFKGDDPSVAG